MAVVDRLASIPDRATGVLAGHRSATAQPLHYLIHGHYAVTTTSMDVQYACLGSGRYLHLNFFETFEKVQTFTSHVLGGRQSKLDASGSGGPQ